ncbi:MAG: hypothetical protein LBC48_01765 [Dysgonamonadaceae bacterium]|jgi:hypothetical protein|nr:hypothetical protein [Dysgonamonadaceae bacterium]
MKEKILALLLAAFAGVRKEADAEINKANQKLIADSIAASTKPLLEQLNTFKAGETAKTRLQALNDKLKDCNDIEKPCFDFPFFLPSPCYVFPS